MCLSVFVVFSLMKFIPCRKINKNNQVSQQTTNYSTCYITHHMMENPFYRQVTGERCSHYDLPCKNNHGVKTHLKKHCQHVNEAPQVFTDTLTDRKIKRDKIVEEQKLKE